MRTTLEMHDGIAWITMDDGKVNAMSTDMLREVEGRLEQASQAGGPIVLKGREGMFSAGFDLKVFAQGPEPSRAMVLAGVRLIERMLSLPRPIVTVCTGHAYPMGAFLMLSSDVRYGVEGDWNIGMNEVAIGLAVPQFAIELARYRLTPPGVMRLSTAAMFRPEAAARLGYLDYVVSAERLEAAVNEETLRLAKLDMDKYAVTKARLNAPVLAAIATASAQL